MMHVVAGLGNPGLAYRKSRHNAGFLALDALAERLHIRLTKRGMRGLYGEGIFRGPEEDACTTDGSHPNDIGFMKMADSIGRILRRAMRRNI